MPTVGKLFMRLRQERVALSLAALMARSETGPLTERQAAFVREYLVDCIATKAAIRAGYSRSGAEVTASKLLKNAKVKAAIDAGKAELAAKCEITKEWIVQEAIATYRKAIKLEQCAAARSSLHLIALLHGHIVEKREVRTKSLDEMSDSELAALMGEPAPVLGVKSAGAKH